VFDPDAFAWSDDRWRGTDVRGRVLYELHVGTFTPEGTLRAAIGRLDHLVALGVDVVGPYERVRVEHATGSVHAGRLPGAPGVGAGR
ncbi:MAG TPA: hypothetical protein VFC48_02145, partial [Cellulomonas sp.]|nr:hypothetical protein [Cellulomonas sp.]